MSRKRIGLSTLQVWYGELKVRAGTGRNRQGRLPGGGHKVGGMQEGCRVLGGWGQEKTSALTELAKLALLCKVPRRSLRDAATIAAASGGIETLRTDRRMLTFLVDFVPGERSEGTRSVVES